MNVNDGPAQVAFDAILDLIAKVQRDGQQLSEAEHRKYIDAARDLIPLINMEREGKI